MTVQVQSSSNPNKFYTVDVEGQRCSCPGWTQHMPRRPCKHLRELGAKQPTQAAVAAATAKAADVGVGFAVMLAADAQESQFVFPVLASPKIDGFRGYVRDGVLRTRSNKRHANQATDEFFSDVALEGLDGELVVGSPVSKDAFHNTTSALRAEQHDPKATFLVFDLINSSAPFEQRLVQLQKRVDNLPAKFHGRVVVVTHVSATDLKQLLAFEERCVDQGFEGLIVRRPNGPYKNGRSTVDEGWMLKLKRFVDSEAVIVGMEEEQDQRKQLKGTMGALIVRDLKSGVEFNVGTGFSAKDRVAFWRNRDAVVGQCVKYKYQLVGTRNKPRSPVYLGIRDASDMDAAAVSRAKQLQV